MPNTPLHSDTVALMQAIQKSTGFTPTLRDEDIVVKPEMCGKAFFRGLLAALVDFPHTFIVNRELEILIFKP